MANTRNKQVVVGNGRLVVAKRMGWSHVAVVWRDLTPKQQRALSIADNRSAELADWDLERLEAELAGMEVEDKGLYDDLLLSELRAEDHEMVDVDEVEPQIDRAAELQEKWGTELGQLWLIPSKTVEGGEHRVLCGDSTKAEDVGRVMGGQRAGLMNTDPPYGVGYANDERPNPGVAKPRVANDELSDEVLQAFLEKAFRVATEAALQSTAAWYMWHAHLTQGYFAAAAAAAAAADVILHRQIIWIKPVLLLGRGQYHWKHEPCFMGWVKGHQPPDYGMGNGERTQTTVWEIGSVSHAERKKYNHSTPKPVGLFTIPIIKHLKCGEICFEPFGGSGPQWVAAEQLSRLCYGIELEPKYVAVILERLTDMGLTPRLEN